MMKIPLCGTCSVSAADTITIFVGNDCFGSVVFLNCSDTAVDILVNGAPTGTPIATIEPGCKLALSLESLSSLALDFTAAGNVSYKGCICCNGCPCAPTCDVV